MTHKKSALCAGAFSLLMGTLLSCSPQSQGTHASLGDPATRLQAIPAADPKKYLSITEMKNWKNPYLIVREDGIGLLDLSNNEIHILRPDEVPAALAALSASAWPYGRVVAIQANGVSQTSEAGKIQIRKNRALLEGTLEDLKVAIHWIPSA